MKENTNYKFFFLELILHLLDRFVDLVWFNPHSDRKAQIILRLKGLSFEMVDFKNHWPFVAKYQETFYNYPHLNCL